MNTRWYKAFTIIMIIMAMVSFFMKIMKPEIDWFITFLPVIMWWSVTISIGSYVFFKILRDLLR